MSKKVIKFYSNTSFIGLNIIMTLLILYYILFSIDYMESIIDFLFIQLLYNLYAFIFKSDLYKISFDEKGIKLWYLGKCEKEYQWDEIVEVGVYFRFDRLYLSTIRAAEYHKNIAYSLKKSQPYVTLNLSKKAVLEIIKYYDKEIVFQFMWWMSIHKWLNKINEAQRGKLINKRLENSVDD